MNARPEQAGRRDEGFTLVELLITSFLAFGVIAVSAWMLVTALNGGRDVSASGNSTSEAQRLVRSISDVVPSSADVALGPFAVSGQLLKATYVEFDASGQPDLPWACVYWAVTSDGRAYTKRTPTAATIPTDQYEASFAGWSLIASGLEPISPSRPILSQTGASVGISARADAEGGAPAVVDASVAVRALPADPGGLTC